jgi:uncharacterized protein YndB with AHSA1/START domain
MDDAAVMHKPSLTLNRRIKAPREKVFDAFLDPKKVAQWFGGGAPESKTIEIEPRVGGRYHFGFTDSNGEQSDVFGEYKVIAPPGRLVFSWYWRTTPERVSQVTVTLAPDGKGTMLSLLHEQFFDEDARDRHGVGWGYGLDALVGFVERAKL